MQKSTFLFSLLLPLAIPLAAHASPSGRTADGCTYRVINGQYLTRCDKKAKPKKEAAKDEGSDEVSTKDAAAVTSTDIAPSPLPVAPPTPAVSTQPVSSYSDVPVRANPYEAIPSVDIVRGAPLPAPGQSAPAPTVMAPAPAPVASAPIAPAPVAVATQGRLVTRQELQREIQMDENARRRHDMKLARELDKVSLGVDALAVGGRQTVGTAAGIGADLSIPFDEFFDVEIAYAYSGQNMNLGLAERSGGDAAFGNDSNLATHLATAEVRGFFTSALRRVRPFLGLGLGFKSSTLTENGNLANGYQSPGDLTQNSFGGVASAGATFRIAKDFRFDLAFKYYVPFARQDARLENGGTPYGAVGDTNLTEADASLTGSSQYQFGGGLQYAF